MLLEEQESENRMRAHADEARHPTLKHPAQALGLGDIRDEADDALVLGGAHDARLDHVDGRADGGGHEARHEGRREVRRQVVLQRRAVQQQPLEDVVRGQLAHRHEHRPRRVGPHPAPEAPDAFFARHAHEPVECVLVLASLLQRERRVVLHAHVEDVAGVADYAADEARGRGHGYEGEEGGFLLCGGEAVFEGFVDAEARHAVGHLAQLGGRKLEKWVVSIQLRGGGVGGTLLHRGIGL